MLKLLFVPCVLKFIQIKYIFLRVPYFLKIKSFTFSCLLYYWLKGSKLFCFLRLYWVFIKSVFAVGSEAVAVCDILIFKNIAFCRNCLLCLPLGVFDWVVVGIVCVIDFAVNWWDSFSCLFVMFCFERIIDWEISDCFFWLFDLIDCSGWLFFVERLWFCEKEEKSRFDGALQCCRC